MTSKFYCSCRHEFSASDVSDAIETLMYTCRRLVEILESSAYAEAAFTRRNETSFRGFMGQILHGLGNAAGFVLGKLLGRFF
jgi:hypothetical protein